MNILMLSHRDRSLVGQEAGGDAARRHVLYGQYVKHLDIIMHSTSEEKLPVHKLAKNVTVYPTNSSRRLFFRKDVFAIASGIARLHQPDLIVSQDPFVLGWVGVGLKKKFGAPLLVHFHGDFWDNPYFLIEHSRNRLLVPLSKRVVRSADAIRVVSPLIAEKIKKVYPDKFVEIISTPVDLAKFEAAPPDLVDEITKQYGEKLILYVGRLEVEKNLQLLLNAFHLISKKVPEVKVLILGNGSELGMLRAYVTKKGWDRKIFFRGNIPHEELPAYYHAAKVLALPSNSESFGKVILEAAAARVPTVATATTGAKTLIREGQTGFLVKIGDGQGLASQIIRLLVDEALRKQLGQQALEHAKASYSQDQNVQKIIDLWERAANL